MGSEESLDSVMPDKAQHPFVGLTPDTVINAVEAQGFLSDFRVLALNSYENRVYQVGIEGASPLIAKFYRPGRWSDEQILEEHSFCAELKEHELSVVPPMEMDGASLFSFGDYRFSLYPRQGGQAPAFDDLDQLLVLGRCLGRIHAIGAVRPFVERPRIDVQGFGDQSVQFLLEEDFIPTELRPAYESLTKDLLELAHQRFHYSQADIRLHGDCHVGNLLWRDGVPHFVDFDDARNGPAIQDIWMMLSGERHQQQLQLAEIVEGYNEFNDFPLSQIPLIEVLRTLRIIHYSAWLARRWQDPAFPHSFPWFNTLRYWSDHILALREQLAALQEPPLQIM